MADVSKMRRDIYRCYDTQTWHDRVNRMHNDQVIAVWHRFSADGKFDKTSITLRRNEIPQPEKTPIFEACYGEQLSFGGMLS